MSHQISWIPWEIWCWSQIVSVGKRTMACRLALWTLTPVQGYENFTSNHCDRYNYVVSGSRIGNDPRAIDCQHDLWPWLTLNRSRFRAKKFASDISRNMCIKHLYPIYNVFRLLWLWIYSNGQIHVSWNIFLVGKENCSPSGERLRGKGRQGVLCRLKAVSSMPERFRMVCTMQGAIQVLWFTLPYLYKLDESWSCYWYCVSELVMQKVEA